MDDLKEKDDVVFQAVGEGLGESPAEAAAQPSDDALNSELESLQKERDEYRDLLLRKQAEFENYRKRILREREDLGALMKSEVLSDLLPVVDACEKGLASMQSAEGADVAQSYLEGYELLLKQLQGLLERHGVQQVPGPGSLFDPKVHEAVLREVNTDFQENEIIEEYRKGYLIEDKLLRASQVKVAAWPED